MRKPLRILFHSLNDPTGLCASYMHAAKQLNAEISFFDFVDSRKRHMPFGRAGYYFQQYVYLETLHHKVNREFVLKAKEFKPDIILFFTEAPVSSGALLLLKSILPDTKLVLVWPDSLLNFTPVGFSNLALFDLVATYSSASVTVLRSVVKGIVHFVPLAGDESLHLASPQTSSKIDVGFAGGWRPERENALEIIVRNFPALNMQIWGPYWKEKCKSKLLHPKIKGRGLHGRALAEFFNSTLINLNVMDDTNYPAANMRFFEILTAGGLELASACPEMEQTFIDQQDLIYFNDEHSLVQKVQWILDHRDSIAWIKNNGYQKLRDGHTYTHRLADILNVLNQDTE